MITQIDVAIVGAGPAGSAAAIALARKGYSVGLLDKERFPREKLCGDFLNPASWPLLRILGVDQGILSREHEKVTAFRVTSISGDEAEVPLSSKHDEAIFGLGLRRSLLDQVLLERAGSEGVVAWQGARLHALKRARNGWFLEVERGSIIAEVHARVLIGADGRNSWVAHRLGLTGSAAMQGRAVGFQLRLRCANGSRGRVEIHLIPGGYAGLVGIGGDMLNLCLAVDKDQLSEHRSVDLMLESALSQNPHLKEILRRSERIGEMRSTYPVYFPPRRSYSDGVLLAGDAARVNEPVTGEGIYFALKSGVFAARTVDEAFGNSDFSAARLHSYERECRSAFAMRRGVNALIRWLIYRPALLNPLIRFSARRERLLDSIVHAVCQPEIGR